MRQDRSAFMESPRDSVVREEIDDVVAEAECSTPEAKHVTLSKL